MRSLVFFFLVSGFPKCHLSSECSCSDFPCVHAGLVAGSLARMDNLGIYRIGGVVWWVL